MTQYQLAPQRRFSSAGRDYLFLVSSTAVVGLDPLAGSLLRAFETGPQSPATVIDSLSGQFGREELIDGLAELNQLGAVISSDMAGTIPAFKPVADPPLSTLVLNVTNKCNLSCKYCYEYGEDRLSVPAASRFMDEATACQSVEFLITRGERMSRLALTFFGGETLLNFAVVRKTIAYAQARSREIGKPIDFALTTNATLLTDETISFLADNNVGVTVSIDGPKQFQDRFRTFKDGGGSYDLILPRITRLLERHRTRPIAARVTLTSQALHERSEYKRDSAQPSSDDRSECQRDSAQPSSDDRSECQRDSAQPRNDVVSIFNHLHDEVGFYEVGFAPVTTSPNTLYAIGDNGFDSMLDQFGILAKRYLDAASRGDYVGFSNMTDTLQEIHTGIHKEHGCGAGLGLLGVSPSGDISLCHRFVDSPGHTMGNIHAGLDEEKRKAVIEQTHISRKPECHTCWVRGLCAGGCYHEAYVRYGDLGHANLHYCDWIRSWIGTCLETYAEIYERNAEFFNRFDERKGYEAS